MSYKTKNKHRLKVVEMLQEELLEWYVVNSGGQLPSEPSEVQKPDGSYIFWMDPPLPNIENPVLIVESVGNWRVRVETRVFPIKGFMP